MPDSPAPVATAPAHTGRHRLRSGVVLAAMLLAACQGAPEPHRAPGRSAALRPTPDAAKCLADLGTRLVNFTPVPDRYYGAGCSTINTVRITRVSSDTAWMTITNLGPVACPLANAFAGWARFGVDRAARQYLGSPLARIETMGSYNCRNIAGSDRLSGHATGNAIDVSAFVLEDGRRISVLGDWSGSGENRAFLQIIHHSACRRFGTVLGPDYNAAHRNHLHLEMSASAFCH